MKRHSWKEIEREQLSEKVARQVIHAERITVARIYLSKGAVVPRHSHENEQVTLLDSGRLRFSFDGGDMLLEAGQAMQIPPNAPHGVEALEDSAAVDLFVPVRQDWVRGDDSYLRR